MCTICKKMGHFKKVCLSRKDCAVHEVGMEMAQEEAVIEEVSINSVYLNNKQLLITAQLGMQVCNNMLKVPYKVDTGSEGNLMLLYIFKTLFRNELVEQLKRSIKGNIKLKRYNGMQIEQLLKLNDVQYMSIIDVSLGYHNLKLDKQLPYLTTFACLFGRYRYKHYCLEQQQQGICSCAKFMKFLMTCQMYLVLQLTSW